MSYVPAIAFLQRAGIPGGQDAIGGTGAGEELVFQGSSNSNLGQVRMRSPIDFDDVTAANALNPYSIRDASVQSFSASFIGGTFNASPTITFSNAVFVWEALRGAPNIQSLVSPAFAAFALFQGLPLLRAGPTAGHNPLNALTLNAGVTQQNEFTGTKSVATSTCINFAHSLKTTIAGAVLNCTTFVGLQCSPQFSTVAGSTINFGTIVGVLCNAPAPGLFQPAAGTELMTAYYGLQFNNMTFGGASATYSVIRSLLNSGTNKRFLDHTGTAESRLRGNLRFDTDLTGVIWGASGDFQTGWAAGNFQFFQCNTVTSAVQLRWTPAAREWQFSGATTVGFRFNVAAVSFGSTSADPNNANWFTIFAAPNLRAPAVAGEYSDVLWTASGSISIPAAFAMSNVQAFKINSPAIILGAGASISDLSNLYVEAMPSFGGTRMQALRVLGRTRVDGIMCHNSATLAQLTADVAALALPPNNAGRFVLLASADALGPWTIQGIVNVQVGDSIYVVNTGANAFDFGHEDGAAAAANRIITPTAATWTLGPREFAKLWYDSVATRWRILESNGA